MQDILYKINQLFILFLSECTFYINMSMDIVQRWFDIGQTSKSYILFTNVFIEFWTFQIIFNLFKINPS